MQNILTHVAGSLRNLIQILSDVMAIAIQWNRYAIILSHRGTLGSDTTVVSGWLDQAAALNLKLTCITDILYT